MEKTEVMAQEVQGTGADGGSRHDERRPEELFGKPAVFSRTPSSDVAGRECFAGEYPGILKDHWFSGFSFERQDQVQAAARKSAEFHCRSATVEAQFLGGHGDIDQPPRGRRGRPFQPLPDQNSTT
jgi:hypothetical protein